MYGDDDDRLWPQGSALSQWFSRSPDDIEEERRQAEQAGREAYAEAIRTGQPVQSQTSADLLALGRARLAQQTAGQATSPSTPDESDSSSDNPPPADPNGYDRPLTNPADNYPVAGPVTAPAFPHAWDGVVEREVGKYNKMNQADPGDDVYLDPDLVKAMIRVESGHDMKAYNSDPMQVNKHGDWDGYKGEIGLKQDVPPGPEFGIHAGLEWLDSKSYYEDTAGQPKPFIGYENALKRYNGYHNGHGNPHYWEDVQREYRDIKNGGR